MRHWIRLCGCTAAIVVAALALQCLSRSAVLAHSGDDEDSEPADEDIDSPRMVAPETARFIHLKTDAAATISLADSIALSGRVGPLPDARRKVCARFGGAVTAVHKQIGEPVK